MILSIAHAEVDEAIKDNLFGEWSNLVTGDRPTGLAECFLLEGDGVVQVAALWENLDAYDRAIGDEGIHPAFAVFDAVGADPTHSVFQVVGHFGR